MSSLSSIEGTISAKPFGNTLCGGLNGTLRAPNGASGTVRGESPDSPESAAVAELGNLISSLGTLSSQAQSLPLSPPTLPQLPQNQNYRPQATDYTQLADDSN